LVINIVFIPKFGYIASAVATLIAYTTMASISYILGQKHYAIPYNLKKIGLYLILSVGLSILSFYKFRGDYIIGIGLILILMMVIWNNEKTTLKQLIKS